MAHNGWGGKGADNERERDGGGVLTSVVVDDGIDDGGVEDVDDLIKIGPFLGLGRPASANERRQRWRDWRRRRHKIWD